MKDDNFYIETIHKTYHGEKDPVFFRKEDFPWVADMEACHEAIMASLLPALGDAPVGFVANPERHLYYPHQGWKSLPFYFNGIRFKKNLSRFPFVAAQLATIPHLISASVSVLEPGTRLRPHNGSTNGIMRVHYPLKVPGRYPDCGMVIEGHEVSWEEGRVIMFCDMKIHHVQNLTDKKRYILMMDVVRPEFSHLKKKICVHTIAQVATNVIMDLIRRILR